jgi:AAA15 family ATPase/GTPase
MSSNKNVKASKEQQKKSDILQTRLHTLEVSQDSSLKTLKSLHISFEDEDCPGDKNITAILGPNGHGKSTILHILACCFHDSNQEEGYTFNKFFPSIRGNPWPKMEVTIWQSYLRISKEDKGHPMKRTDVKNEAKTYKRKERWPIANRRFERQVIYLGLDKCVPLVEIEKNKKLQKPKNWKPKKIEDKDEKFILSSASTCMNRKYSSLLDYEDLDGKKNLYRGVEYGSHTYSALTMSAGEQKLFTILESLCKLKKYGILLIDEIDVLLHDSALIKLIPILVEKAKEKNIQVIFTTHRERVLEFSSSINIRHIFSTEKKTLCFEKTTPQCMERLSGKREKVLDVFVEDDISEGIVKQVSRDLGISRDVNPRIVGPAKNVINSAIGLYLSGQSLEDSLFLMDGDVYRNADELKKQVGKVFTGSLEKDDRGREKVFLKITHLLLPEKSEGAYPRPEEFIHESLKNTLTKNELLDVVRELEGVFSSHDYVDEIVKKMDESREVVVRDIIKELASLDCWIQYTSNLRKWLEDKKKEKHL